MSKYGSVSYGQPYYGQKSRLAFSIEPFIATAVSYSSIILDWSSPVGGYTAFRILRNQEGYSETAEDGAVIYEEFNIDGSTGAVAISTFNDGVDNPTDPALISGKFVYYRAWILKSSDNVWYPAGSTYTLLPNAHPTYGPNKLTLMTTQDKVMNLIPRTFTSASQTPIDEVNPDSDLYRFFQGISFTFDEFLTMTDSLIPNYSGDKTSPLIIGVQADDLGLTREPTLSVKHQKAMIREALYMYSRKGTLSGLQTLVESASGYDAVVTESPNLMLSNEDSTFSGGVGSWLPIGDCTIQVEDVHPVTSESLSIDSVYSAKVEVSTAGAKISNGDTKPVTRGVPVTAGFDYTYSAYLQTSSGSADAVLTITWYDFEGAFISSDSGTAYSVTTTWDKATLTATAPSEAVYASIDIEFASSGTYYVDMVQVSLSDVDVFHEARSVDVFLNPTKTNFLSNPSFEVSNSSWVVSPGTATYVSTDVSPYVLVGSKALQLASGSTTATTNTLPSFIKSSGFYSLSVFARTISGTESLEASLSVTTEVPVSTASISANVATLSLSSEHPVIVGDAITVSGVGTAFNGQHTVISVEDTLIRYSVSAPDETIDASTGSVEVSKTEVLSFSITESWNRKQLSLYLPSGYVRPNSFFTVSFGGVFLNDVQLDAAQLELGYKASDYFDGDYGTERDALWDGAVSESPSYLYPNKIDNVSRLSVEIPKFIPYDTPWILSSYSGTEASGIS